jgi:hypothetical protein
VTEIDVKQVVGEVAAKHGVLIEENDPLMVALSANGVVLEALARGLLAELESVSARLENMRLDLPDEVGAALKEAAEHAATSVRRGLELDIEGAGLKARAIVDAVYRAQSRVAMWMWIATGLVAGTAVFGAGIMVGHFWWQ